MSASGTKLTFRHVRGEVRFQGLNGRAADTPRSAILHTSARIGSSPSRIPEAYIFGASAANLRARRPFAKLFDGHQRLAPIAK
jgi:hypothetical protein